MKSILISAAAIAMVASSPALAARPSAGGDGIGTYEIKGSASNFCQLGQINGNSEGAAGYNTTIDYTTANSGGYSGGTSDAMINITQLQDSDDHADAWRAVINMHHSVCNTAYTVTANSANGGLQYQGQATGAGDNFATILPYTIKADFDQNNGQPVDASTAHNNDAQLLTSSSPSAGNFRLAFNGRADNGQYLLSGDYTDTVVVRLTANTGTSA